jgi:predicted dehydrogenase
MTIKPISIVLRGLGAAGRARLEALAAAEGLQLAGLVSRRKEIATLSWEEALSREDIDAVAVSTENTDHESAVAAALAAGKHVLCDFPLAFSAARARALFQLAREQGHVLHVEHIGLLTRDHAQLKRQAEGLGSVRRGDYLFQGGWNRKLADPSRTGPLPILSLSRLLQIADIFGPFTIAAHEAKIGDKGFSLHLHLNFLTGGTLGFTEERMEGLSRRRSLIVDCEKGPLHWKATVGSENLFAQDLIWFRDRIIDHKPCYYDEELMIKIIGELERVNCPPPPATAWEK